MYSTRPLIPTALLFLYLSIASSSFLIRGVSAPPVNNPPTAVNDSYTLHGNGTIGSLLANDSDPENNTMSVQTGIEGVWA